jgi:hypothetical protein
MSVSAGTALSKAQFLFASCLFTQLVVVDGHQVVGVIHRQDMADPMQAAAAVAAAARSRRQQVTERADV